MEKRTSKQRRALIVPHVSHRRLILKICLILLALVLISGVAFYVLAQQRLAGEFYSAHSQIETTMQMLLPWMIIVYLLGLGAAVLMTVIYTRGLAGPVFRLGRQLDLLARGEFGGQIHLRGGDEFQELAVQLNELSGSMEDRFLQVEDCRRRLISLADGWMKQEEAAHAPETNQLIRQLEAIIADLEGSLNSFADGSGR